MRPAGENCGFQSKEEIASPQPACNGQIARIESCLNRSLPFVERNKDAFLALAKAPLPSSCKWVSPRELAACVRRSPSWCYRLIERGVIPARRLKHVGLRISLPAAVAFLRSIEPEVEE